MLVDLLIICLYLTRLQNIFLNHKPSVITEALINADGVIESVTSTLLGDDGMVYYIRSETTYVYNSI